MIIVTDQNHVQALQVKVNRDGEIIMHHGTIKIKDGITIKIKDGITTVIKDGAIIERIYFDK